MKALLNWRSCVRYALLVIGLVCIILASGEDDRPIVEWVICHLGLFGLGIGSFALLGKLKKEWESN